MKLRKDDTVVVIAGKERGKKGKIVRVLAARDMVLVEGINMVKRAQRATRTGQKGQIIDKHIPIHVSNVMLVDPTSGKPTRISITRNEKGMPTRVSRKSNTALT